MRVVDDKSRACHGGLPLFQATGLEFAELRRTQTLTPSAAFHASSHARHRNPFHTARQRIVHWARACAGVAGGAAMTRGLVRMVARGLIGLLLFSQLAIAAYACPALSAGLASGSSTAMSVPMAQDAVAATDDARGSAMQGSPCADMVGATDTASSNLCAEHCKYGQQSDHAFTLTVPAVLLSALYPMTPWVPETAPPARPAAASLSALVAASPPHAILHCVYRT